MKRFVWRLQKVLDVKTKQEQLKRNELFQIAEQLAARRGELLLRRRILQDLMTEIREQPGPARWSAQEFFLRHADDDNKQIRRLEEELAALQVRHKEKTAEVLAVRRFKEGLEKLRPAGPGRVPPGAGESRAKRSGRTNHSHVRPPGERLLGWIAREQESHHHGGGGGAGQFCQHVPRRLAHRPQGRRRRHGSHAAPSSRVC